MAVIRDVMPAFELFQPASIADALTLLDRYGSRRVGAGRRPRQLRLAEGPHQAAAGRRRSRRRRRAAAASASANGGLEIGAMTTLTEVVRHPVVRETLQPAARGGRSWSASPQIRNQGTIGGNVSQDTRCWYYRARLVVLSRRRQHLLRRHADGDQPRARHPRRRPLRGGQPVGHRAGADRARRVDGDPQRERRARRRRRGLLHRARHRHHAHERPAAGRAADGDSHSRRRGPARSSTSRRCATARCGTSRSSASRRRWSCRATTIDEHAPGRQRRRGAAAAPDGGRGRSSAASRATRRPRTLAGELADRGRAAAAVQRLQGAADAEPGEARDPRGGGHGLLPDVGPQPVGPADPHARLVEPALGVAVRRRGCSSSRTRATWCSPRIASGSRPRPTRWRRARTDLPPQIPRHSLVARAVPLGDGGVDVHAALHGVPADRRRQVRRGCTWHWMAGLVLTASILFHIIHATFWLDFWSIWVGPKDLPELKAEMLRELGHDVPGPEAGQVSARQPPLSPRDRRRRPRGRSRPALTMMVRVRTPLFTRNPYLLGDSTWGFVYVHARPGGRRRWSASSSRTSTSRCGPRSGGSRSR